MSELTFEAKLSDKVQLIVSDAVADLSAIDDDPYIREAVARIAIRELSWGLLSAGFGSKYELADQLGTMGEVLQRADDDSS